MSLIRTFISGQHFFQSSILKYGKFIDNGEGDAFTTEAEAHADGENMADAYDPEWQKRYPNCIEYIVSEFVCKEVDADGSCGIAISV